MLEEAIIPPKIGKGRKTSIEEKIAEINRTISELNKNLKKSKFV